MLHRKISTTDAAVHVATVADVVSLGSYISFRSGKKRSLPLVRHAFINNRPFALFYDATDDVYELYEALSDRPIIKFVKVLSPKTLNALEGNFAVFRDHPSSS